MWYVKAESIAKSFVADPPPLSVMKNKSLLVALLVCVASRANAQVDRQAQLAALPDLSVSRTDRGLIFNRGSWSVAESPNGRFVAFTANDGERRDYRAADIPHRLKRPHENRVIRWPDDGLTPS